MLSANPQIAFIDTLYQVLYENNPLAPTAVPRAANYEKINLDRAIAIYKEQLGDAAGMHITMVGSFNEDTVIALLEKYAASLPVIKARNYTDNKVRPFKGQNDFQFKKGKDDKSLVLGVFHGEVPYNSTTELQLEGLSEVMNISIIEEMREKIQGIYGGGTQVQLAKLPIGNFQFILQLPCGPAKVDTLVKTFRSQLEGLAKNGVDTGYVSKVKKAWIEKYRVDSKKNEYWLAALQEIKLGERNADQVVNAEKYFNAFSAADVKKAANLLLNAKGKMIAVQMPAELKTETKSETKGF